MDSSKVATESLGADLKALLRYTATIDKPIEFIISINGKEALENHSTGKNAWRLYERWKSCASKA